MANNSPEANFRLGNVTATVWCNESSGGSGNRKYRTVQLDQLLRLRVCIDKAVAHISESEMET